MGLATVLILSSLSAVAEGGRVAAAATVDGGLTFAGKRLGKPVIYMRGPGLRRPRVVPTRGWASGPAVSPGGRRIAFSRRGRLGAQIWTVYLEGAGLVRLTDGPRDYEPRWSPAGDAVVFARGRPGRRDIFTVRADGTGLRRLTFRSTDDRSPSWSLRQRIAFVRRGRDRHAGGEIYDVAAAGGRARRLTHAGVDDRTPAWSPGGGRLAFARGRPGEHDLYLLGADRSHPRRLTALPGDESEPAWSPDGRSIAFTYSRHGRRRLLLLRIRRRPPRVLDSPELRVLSSARAEPRTPGWRPVGVDPVVAAAGDIACDPGDPYFEGGLGAGPFCRQRQTSDLLLRMDLAGVLALGDLQYECGGGTAFAQSYDPSWGRVKSITRPAPGNKEYATSGGSNCDKTGKAAGYYNYFGAAAGDPTKGYYSYNLGSWHLIALNSNCSSVGGCGAGSPQEKWLTADLAASSAACTLAYWHHPRFSSSTGDTSTVSAFWDDLYAANADLVLNGHSHVYERFAAQTPAEAVDNARGVREFIVGTGGRSFHSWGTIEKTSQVRNNTTFGVLKLTLRPTGYDWQFVPEAGKTFTDSGTTPCH